MKKLFLSFLLLLFIGGVNAQGTSSATTLLCKKWYLHKTTQPDGKADTIEYDDRDKQYCVFNNDFTMVMTDDGYPEKGHWKWADQDKKITVVMYEDEGDPETMTLSITRLTNTDLVLQGADEETGYQSFYMRTTRLEEGWTDFQYSSASTDLLCKKWYIWKSIEDGKADISSPDKMDKRFLQLNKDYTVIAMDEGEPLQGTWSLIGSENKFTVKLVGDMDPQTITFTILSLTGTDLVVKGDEESTGGIIGYLRTAK